MFYSCRLTGILKNFIYIYTIFNELITVKLVLKRINFYIRDDRSVLKIGEGGELEAYTWLIELLITPLLTTSPYNSFVLPKQSELPLKI